MLAYPLCRFPAILPREIVDLVIDNLHNDSSSLRVCGLLGRSWLTSSRYHIFSSINLSPRNVESFLKIVDNQSPSNFRSIVRKVTITLRPYTLMVSYDSSLRTTEFDETFRLTHIAIIALSCLENVCFSS